MQTVTPFQYMAKYKLRLNHQKPEAIELFSGSELACSLGLFLKLYLGIFSQISLCYLKRFSVTIVLKVLNSLRTIIIIKQTPIKRLIIQLTKYPSIQFTKWAHTRYTKKNFLQCLTNRGTKCKAFNRSFVAPLYHLLNRHTSTLFNQNKFGVDVTISWFKSRVYKTL